MLEKKMVHKTINTLKSSNSKKKVMKSCCIVCNQGRLKEFQIHMMPSSNGKSFGKQARS
jgi:hypothetical protein